MTKLLTDTFYEYLAKNPMDVLEEKRRMMAELQSAAEAAAPALNDALGHHSSHMQAPLFLWNIHGYVIVLLRLVNTQSLHPSSYLVATCLTLV